MHADIILAQEIADYAALFTEIADAYFEREMYAEARHIYELLGGDAGVSISLSAPLPTPYCANNPDKQPLCSNASCRLPSYARRYQGSR